MQLTYYCLISTCWICKSQLRSTLSVIGPAVPFDGTGSRIPGGRGSCMRLASSRVGSALVTAAIAAKRKPRNFIVRNEQVKWWELAAGAWHYIEWRIESGLRLSQQTKRDPNDLTNRLFSPEFSAQLKPQSYTAHPKIALHRGHRQILSQEPRDTHDYRHPSHTIQLVCISLTSDSVTVCASKFLPISRPSLKPDA